MGLENKCIVKIGPFSLVSVFCFYVWKNGRVEGGRLEEYRMNGVAWFGHTTLCFVLFFFPLFSHPVTAARVMDRGIPDQRPIMK